MTPYFSVITPSFNQGAYIEGCIESVLAQGDRDLEHIVIDNCSTDETPAILSRHPHLRVISEPDRGQSDALNKGIAAARGTVICWLNSDDRYEPGAFQLVRREMKNHAVIFGDTREIFFDGRGERIQLAKFDRREDLLRWWDRSTNLLQPAVFFTRETAEKAGPLREDLHIVMDLEYWWRLSGVAPFHRVDAILATQLRQPESKTMRQVYRMFRERQAVFEPLARSGFAARAGMSARLYQLAQTALTAEPERVRFYLAQSLLENPARLLRPGWWRTLACSFRQP